MPILRISRRTRLRLRSWPSARSIAVIRREPRNGQAAADRKLATIALNEPTAVRGAHLPDLLAKKSRSTKSWPILACSFSISRSRSAAPSPPPFSNARAA
jgi:hypothetical protein